MFNYEEYLKSIEAGNNKDKEEREELTIEPVVVEIAHETIPEKVIEEPKEKSSETKKQPKFSFTKKLAFSAASLVIVSGTFGVGYGAGAGFTKLMNPPAVVSQIPEVASNSNANPFVLTSSLMLQGNNSVSDIFKAVSPSVVSINTKGSLEYNMFGQAYSNDGAGSGIIFNEDNDKIYIVTNYHVISQANGATISIDDKNSVAANYVGGDESNDIAVLSVNKTDLTKAGITNYTKATFGDSDKTQVGDAAIAIGNAAGEGKTATLGIISAVNKKIQSSENQFLTVIQTDAAINPGNSGGALVNADGQVIGINAAKYSDTSIEGMGYAIPSNKITELIGEIMNHTDPGTPFMGIKMATVDESIKESYNFPSLGVYVNEVVENSSAAIAGLQRGDLIVAVNGNPIKTSEELSKIITDSKVGDSLKLTVFRSMTSKSDINVVLKAKGVNF